MPSLSSLRRFGCIVYIHTNDRKLNPRAKRGVFTGYPEGVKGFRVWLLDEQKCTISRSVVFKEDKLYKDVKADVSSLPGDEEQDLRMLSFELSEGGTSKTGSSSQGGAALEG